MNCFGELNNHRIFYLYLLSLTFSSTYRNNESIQNSEHSKNENHFRANQTRNKVTASTMGIKDLDALAKTIKRKKHQFVLLCYCLFCYFFFISMKKKTSHFHR